jgi:hypothetical protein
MATDAADRYQIVVDGAGSHSSDPALSGPGGVVHELEVLLSHLTQAGHRIFHAHVVHAVGTGEEQVQHIAGPPVPLPSEPVASAEPGSPAATESEETT